jgi:CheY-like chemotaxis protein
MALENPKPFYFLDNLINIVLVDDNPEYLSLMKSMVKPVSIYSINTAETAIQAENIITSPNRIHICVLDLGITDMDNDEFYLLKKYGKRSSFIIITGSTSPKRGFIAHSLGAKAVIEKAVKFKNVDFIKTVNRYALLNIINPKYRTNGDTLSVSTDILFEKSPQMVTKWAKYIGITDRSLRHIWKNNLGANAKIILSTFLIFKNAFDYYEKYFRGNISQDKELFHSSKYRHLEEFFHTHKSTITDFISYGDIAAFM